MNDMYFISKDFKSLRSMLETAQCLAFKLLGLLHCLLSVSVALAFASFFREINTFLTNDKCWIQHFNE